MNEKEKADVLSRISKQGEGGGVAAVRTLSGLRVKGVGMSSARGQRGQRE